jgi:hypothetical protein
MKLDVHVIEMDPDLMGPDCRRRKVRAVGLEVAFQLEGDQP